MTNNEVARLLNQIAGLPEETQCAFVVLIQPLEDQTVDDIDSVSGRDLTKDLKLYTNAASAFSVINLMGEATVQLLGQGMTLADGETAINPFKPQH